MTLKFSKYQGTGNDFIMIDERNLSGFAIGIEHIQALCNRRFGIGADGLIVIKSDEQSDFYVDYYNADGSQSFCGNGARCSVKFAQEIGLIANTCVFNAIDGLHQAEIVANGEVKLRMSAVKNIQAFEQNCFVLDTGSPHFVQFVTHLDDLDIVHFGREIRFSPSYVESGINVNAAQITNDYIAVKTYERGVEDETFSCGTGVTAVALAAAQHDTKNQGTSTIKTKGGILQVHWSKNTEGFDSIFLEGPAEKVYDGQIEF